MLSCSVLLSRFFVRFLLSALFLIAGALHLRRPRLFLSIMPPWVPFPRACVLISGILELLGGAGLMIPVPQIRFFTAWGLVLLLIAVFPANIYMATAQVKIPGLPSKAWMAWARLPFQPILILAVLWATQAWPGKCISAQVPNPVHPTHQHP
jgi:uncharacterized membrane protein